MQHGFVIDHARCIGCHACTVACKSENDVPLGNFRTWVKYTERGTFPEVRRSFAVLRCNQCSSAPCVTICPVRALHKRPDGIVDIDPAACIGCKACMQACPYDALYLNDDKGIAEKCHFCAHRVEVGLAPACAVVCPTEAIIPGDFDDPSSTVSQLRERYPLTARKTEAQTGPNVFYRDASPDGLDPLAASSAGGWMWADRMPGAQLDAELFDATLQQAEQRAAARTTYDVDHRVHWGRNVVAYLFTKSIAAGSFLILALMLPALLADPAAGSFALLGLPAIGLLFLGLTSVLLVADLKRPERFFFLLTRPNTRSWLVRGAWVLMAYGALLVLWSALWLVGPPPRSIVWVLLAVGVVLAGLTASYTAWLFAQARGRVLWMRRGLALHFLLQAIVAGAALALLASVPLGLPPDAFGVARWTLAPALVALVLFERLERRGAPPGRAEEFARAMRLVVRGPFAKRRLTAELAGGWLAVVLLLVPQQPALWIVAAGLALFGLWLDEDVLVRGGQALPIS